MNISPETSRRMVLVSIVLLLGMGVYKSSKPGDVGMARRLWGVGMLGLILSAAADFVPTLAGPFALLIVMGYATDGGDKAIENVLGKVSGGGSTVGTTGETQQAPPGAQVTDSQTKARQGQ